MVSTKGEINIHVKNVRESSWELFKNELERVTGSTKPGLGKAISDALDYYRINVLQARSRKEWGGGVRKKVFKQEEKLNKLIMELLDDLRSFLPNFWTVDIFEDIETGKPILRYKINEQTLKRAIRQILQVVDRHTIRNYIDHLEAKNFILWHQRGQFWYLSGVFRLDGMEYGKPELVRIKEFRTDLKGTPEWETWGKKEIEKKVKPKKTWQDLPIIIETGGNPQEISEIA